ncbi:hypothetical protein [Brevundimonas sp. NIBR11]|uniref:hypothetical protein n=1 Tax=Brevundimonas sp. NIBR11 TaxID=3015999 RepID=UPI0022F0E9F7|nr:hypothetical protein [Brevundimonas sp. NIBR11]WGM31901.1 hypothetical protein KKHFBJBL_02151 [Brevundimonas sp. NIBR11]
MMKAKSRLLLVAVSDELAEICVRLEALSELTTELVSGCPAERRAEAMAGIQAFDLLIQRLEGLGGMAAAVGAGAPIATALHALTLSDLYERLVGEPPVRPSMSAASSGELTLFD